MSKMARRRLEIAALVGVISVGALLIQLSPFTRIAEGRFIENQEPDYLTFEELKSLSQDPHPEGRLEGKLERFWKTPLINNEAYYRGAKPHRPSDPKLGPYLRLASWNIEKSYETKNAVIAFTSADKFAELIDPGKAAKDSERYKQVMAQREKLMNADVIVLQEMDIGVKRSGYVNAAAEIAKALNMNYAYGVEQLEIDPVVLGVEKIQFEGGDVDQEATDHYAADPGKYKGMFGSAVLSRYPIKRAEVFQLKRQAYDWYHGEKEKTSFLENARRVGSETVFKNQITREIKLGGRNYFRVDLEVPGLPERTLTIIDIHLEIKCQPIGRTYQIGEILSYTRGIKHPVIVAGDFNAAGTDLSPTSISRTATRAVKNPTNWFSAAVSYLSPYGLIVNTTRGASNVTKNFQDPLARDIKILAPNPVKEMFEVIEGYRFDDGGVFDFRGSKDRSINGNDGTLSNSNERDFKGFKTTFSVTRPIGPWVGKLRLDWVFVKSNFLKDEPRAASGPYRFSPHYGETLEELNTSLKHHISDHHPNVVDLPFKEPKS